MHAHRLLEAAAHVKKFQTEIAVRHFGPQRFVPVEADGLIFVIVQLQQRLRRQLGRRLVRLARHRARLAFQGRVIEGSGRTASGGAGGGG
jgi:hypothetical protein